MRQTDPFPIPHQGLTPTHRLDWEAMARKVVRDVLRLERHERVLISADPYCGGAMLDAVRAEIQRAGAIELATMLHWTPALTLLRKPDGTRVGPDGCGGRGRGDPRSFRDRRRVSLAAERLALAARDPCRRPERAHPRDLAGRSVHFHWFHDPGNPDPDHPANLALDTVYQDAVLKLDYGALRRRMRDLAARMAERELSIRTPAGTDLRFRTGHALPSSMTATPRGRRRRPPRSPRDREEEIPCGALRTIPLGDTVEGVIALHRGFGFPPWAPGSTSTAGSTRGCASISSAVASARVETDGDQAALDRAWAAETGDKDRLGEMVLGCNPLLRPVEGLAFPPYHGFGDAVLRLTIGENIESGGQNRSSLHRWLMFVDADIRAGDDLIVSKGRLTGGEAG